MTKQNKARLTEHHLRDMAVKYPNVPSHCIPMKTWSDSSANGLTKCVVDFLNYEGHQAERISTMGTFKEAKKVTDLDGKILQVGKGMFIPTNGTKGSADISSTINVTIHGVEVGISVKWEVKIGKDRQSQDQKNYEEKVKAAKGHYYIIKSFDEFIDIYDALLVKFR